MENRRNFSRFDTQLKAHYFLNEQKEDGEECTVIDISRKGMGIRFDTADKINIGSTIHLEISIPPESDTISVKGILKRINQKESDLIGGIEWWRN